MSTVIIFSLKLFLHMNSFSFKKIPPSQSPIFYYLLHVYYSEHRRFWPFFLSFEKACPIVRMEEFLPDANSLGWKPLTGSVSIYLAYLPFVKSQFNSKTSLFNYFGWFCLSRTALLVYMNHWELFQTTDYCKSLSVNYAELKTNFWLLYRFLFSTTHHLQPFHAVLIMIIV